MNPLITITSCKRDKDAGCHDAIRNTWGKNCPLDFRFILGQGNTIDHPDELVFDVPDDYAHVTYKTRASHRWAIDNGYDWALQSFVDVYLNLKQMLNSDFGRYPYTGRFGGCTDDRQLTLPDYKGRYGYASGGGGYWTNGEATQVLAESEIDLGVGDVPLMSWAEDLWTGTALGVKGIFGHHDFRYRVEGQWILDAYKSHSVKAEDIYSLHMGTSTGVYDPRWMYEAYAYLK